MRNKHVPCRFPVELFRDYELGFAFFEGGNHAKGKNVWCKVRMFDVGGLKE